MTNLNQLFRVRIGFPDKEDITFDKLDLVLEKTAKTIPFENLCIIKKNFKEITKDQVINKILKRNEGGLCYELNTILYYFLKENGFNVELFRAIVYNVESRSWSKTGRTHVFNLLMHNGQQYVVDTGFGTNLALKPVPLNGNIASSSNGDFRVRKDASEHGDFLFQMKLKHRDEDWVNGYIFDSTRPLKDVTELNEVQQLIAESPFSAFNKGALVTKLTDNGNIILTGKNLTQRVNGKEIKEEIDHVKFIEHANKHFGLHERNING